MKARGYKRHQVTIQLEGDEQFEATNDKGLPFKVWQIMYQDGNKATMTGTAILVDGTIGSNDRHGDISLTALSPLILSAICIELAVIV